MWGNLRWVSETVDEVTGLTSTRKPWPSSQTGFPRSPPSR